MSMKQYFMKGASALLLGGFLASCSHEEFDISTYVADKVKAYEQVFTSEFGSIDPEQDWGFGTTATEAQARSGLTRADHSWDGVHTCFETNWESKLNFKSEADLEADGAIKLDNEANSYYSDYYKKTVYKIPSGKVFYVSSSFSGELILDGGFQAGDSFYNYGTITGIAGCNFNGTASIYNAGTMTYNIGQQEHNVYNIGILKVNDNDAYAKMTNLYNGGHLELGGGGKPAELRSALSIYSNGKGTINLPDGGNLMSTCDIHGTINVTGDLKIQNSTSKYICGIIATGSVENVDGPLYTSYVKANYFSSDGNPIYLTAGGYINVATTIKIYNAKCLVYAATGSTALIKTRDFIFENDNDLDRTFSDEIHFNITGSIDCSAATNLPGGDSSKKVYTVAEYIAQFGDPNERINTGNASGSPACGEAWSIGTGGGGGEIELPIEDPTEGEATATKKYYRSTQLIDQGRVFCEDLGQISSNDLDFNDIVFDAYIYEIKEYTETIDANDNVIDTVTTSVQYDYEVTLWAAGGTLTLSVAEKDVKNSFNTTTGTLVNTASADDEAYGNPWTECNPMTLKDTGDYKQVAEIPIFVQYGNGEVLMLNANLGQAPHKILVPIGTPWTKERQKIAEAYEDFEKYVNNSSVKFWDGPKDDSKLYHHPKDNAKARSTEAVVEILGTELGTSSSEGGYNGTPVLSRERR